jgi:hypothetical protein
MTWDELDTSHSHDTFNIPRWHEETALWLDFCEQYWRHLRREREVMRLGPPPGYRGGDEVPYQMSEDRRGRQLPGVARAAAGLRRSLARAVAQLLPETGVAAAADGEDAVERAMVRSPGWEEALGIALGDIDRVKGLIASVRPGWGLTATCAIPEVLVFLRDELERQVRGFEVLTRPRLAKLSTGPLMKTGYTRLPADRINKAMIEALAPGAMKELPAGYLGIFGPEVRFWRAYAFGTGRRPQGYDQLVGVIGLKDAPDESLWKLLRRSSALAVKIHLALWGRAYVEAAGTGTYATQRTPLPTDYVNTTLASLCDDVGLKRKKGSHKRESREAVAELLKLLTNLELICVYKPPHNVPLDVIRGAVWRRGIVPADAGHYRDLFAPKAGKGLSAVPRAYSYAPGYYFQHPTWRAHNKYVALVHGGLLGMSCRNDHRWAVMVGAYLSILARANRYKVTPLSMRTVAERTGLWAVYGEKDKGAVEDQLGAAFGKLRKAGVIRDVKWVQPGVAVESVDTGDGKDSPPANRAAGKAVKKRKKDDDLKFEVTWPEEVSERGKLLRERRRKKRGSNSA